MKRNLESDLVPAKAEKMNTPWFVRVGILQPESAENRYGPRASVSVSSFLTGKEDLIRYSLIIPAFTQRQDILSEKGSQRGQAWLWGVYDHLRYFGILDMDMDIDTIKEGKEPLFTDTAPTVYKLKGDVKAAFATRMLTGLTFGQILTICPAFNTLYRAVRALMAALQVEYVPYFSGGGGFRVLFVSPHAWRMVTWGQLYAMAFHTQELKGLLKLMAPALAEEPLACILAATDKNVYDSDKGTKPDLLAHYASMAPAIE